MTGCKSILFIALGANNGDNDDMPEKPSGNIRGHLGTSEAIWGHLGHLGLSGTIWGHLGPGAICAIRGHLWPTPFGDIWSHMGLSGAIWGHLSHQGPSGAIGGHRSHLEAAGAIWSHLRPSGGPKSSREFQEPELVRLLI